MEQRYTHMERTEMKRSDWQREADASWHRAKSEDRHEQRMREVKEIDEGMKGKEFQAALNYRMED